MATLNLNDKLLNKLKQLEIDLNKFPDLTFDGLCENESNKHFLNWFCDNLDIDNCIDESLDVPVASRIIGSDNIPEEIGDSYDDIYDDLKISLERKLEEDKASLQELLLLEKKQIEEEKKVKAKLSQTRKNLNKAVARDGKNLVEENSQRTLKICTVTQPDLKDLKSIQLTSEPMQTALDEVYHACSIDITEDNTQMDNLEDVLVQAEYNWAESLCQLEAAKTWIKAPTIDVNPLMLSQIKKCEIENESKKKVVNLLKCEYWEHLRREYNNKIWREESFEKFINLFESGLTLSNGKQLYFEFFDDEVKNLTNTINAFIASVSHEINVLERVEMHEKVQAPEAIQRKKETQISCAHLRQINTSHEHLLRSLKGDFMSDMPFRLNVGMLISYLRCGPTLRFSPIPHDLMVLLKECEKELQPLMKQIRIHAAASCRKPENGSTPSQHWVSFLLKKNLERSINFPLKEE